MPKKNKSYSEEFKRHALELAETREGSMAQLERELGIAVGLIYKWRERYRLDNQGGKLKPSVEREQENNQLLVSIREVYDCSRQSYGSPRIQAELEARGQAVNRKRIARLIRDNGIRAKRKQGYKTTTQRHPSAMPAPNLIAQDFEAQAVNEKWLADITYIATRDEWLYLAVILDVYSRKIVGCQ